MNGAAYNNKQRLEAAVYLAVISPSNTTIAMAREALGASQNQGHGYNMDGTLTPEKWTASRDVVNAVARVVEAMKVWRATQ